MSQQTQAEREGWATGSLDRERYMKLANVVLGIPLSVEHAIQQRQPKFGSNVSPITSQPDLPIRPATTEPLHANSCDRPDLPERSVTEPDAEDCALVAKNDKNVAVSSIQEDPTRQMIGMFSKAAGWVDFMAKLDTGVEGNWITEKCLEELKVRTQQEVKLLTFATFDGKKVESRKEVKISWAFDKGQKTHRTFFRVAPNSAPFNVVLGRVFLIEEDIVNFKINGSLLLFVTEARKEAEEKAIAEKKAQVEIENKALAQKQLQQKALKKHLASKKTK